MLKSKSRWMVRQTNEEKVQHLQTELAISPLVASLLVNRGIECAEEARKFLYTNDQAFHDPFLLKDMDKAVNRMKEAIEKQEQIFIFGDYDADGVSSTTVMMKTLLDLGANVQYYIPNRFTEGYGPNEPAFRHLASCGVSLIITVDTGISALHEAQVAKELGIDLIITDHHEPGPVLPEAYAIVHPKLHDSTYPFRELAGVGVAFKLSHALYGKVPEHLLDIVVIGTVADLVSLTGENRLIVTRGIKKMKSTTNIGLQALLKLASVNPSTINEETIGFTLGPRINAAGRLESADIAVDLLLTDDENEAMSIAEEMEQLNKQRQAIVNQIAEEAIKEVEENYPVSENSVLILGKEGWNAGVIGIVASKLVERYYRPTIILSYDLEKGLAKGSARSIAGFDLFQNLSTCRELLPHFGGHPMAAGMTLKIDDVDELRARLNSLANEQLTDEDFIPVVNIDSAVSLAHIDLKAIEEMQMLSPYGVDNPKPKVLIDSVELAQIRKIGSEQNHLKVTLAESSAKLDGVGFGLGHLYEHIAPSAKISVIGELSINEWNNIRKPQIFLADMAVETWQLFDFRGNKKQIHYIDSIPKHERKWIVFDSDHTALIPDYQNEAVICVESEDDAKQLSLDGQNVIVVDMPPTKEVIEQLFVGKKPSRVYVQFYKRDSDFFSTVPTREHFKWFYAFLAKKGPLNMSQHGHLLAKHRGWSKETIEFMSQVFFELDFVTINNGLISLQKTTQKRDLTESKTYQKKLAQFSLENDLLFSSYQQLKGWFDQMIQGSVHNEEEINAWI
ncbi:single-stranded-DNA-specific exonuclease RecJ [Bacillus sp. DNRA2]|uniref:single-stranded-DNA-specific exonuclease RecJ n=1 Tax=Bacillus sp. DNRA2 TaxID=2723053 RepID=UPI00145EEB30|nr:single-stranded-DNA-specific exonuclease RecJ [Bacillus sp. DNRA2]NMD70580.1 single-stranded-DNA-specific exonuclease RecJ [Bacillus sp. DNRA2]